MGRDAWSWLLRDAWPSRWARCRRRLAMYFFFSSGFLFFQWTLSWTKTTSVLTGLVRSVCWSSASGSSSITVCRDVDFPLPAIPTITSLVKFPFGDSLLHFFLVDLLGTSSSWQHVHTVINIHLIPPSPRACIEEHDCIRIYTDRADSC